MNPIESRTPLDDEMDRVLHENSVLTAELASLRAERDKYRDANVELQLNEHRYLEGIDELRAENARLEAENAKMESDSMAMEAKHLELRAERDGLAEMIKAAYHEGFHVGQNKSLSPQIGWAQSKAHKAAESARKEAGG